MATNTPLDSYPEHDTTLEAKWRTEYVEHIQRRDDTASSLQQMRAKLAAEESTWDRTVNAAAWEAEMPPNAKATHDAKVAELRGQIDHLSDLLGRQEGIVVFHDSEVGKLHGLSHRPRVLHALKELAEAEPERAAADRALRDAQGRIDIAKMVIGDAWQAGYTIPAPIRPVGVMYPGQNIWPHTLDESKIREIFGTDATEALGPAA